MRGTRYTYHHRLSSHPLFSWLAVVLRLHVEDGGLMGYNAGSHS
jgi:hypothetical protein